MTEKTEFMEMFDMFSESRTFGEGRVQEMVEAYFREMDTDGDGLINFEEFRNYFKPKLPEP
jgi:Ca2+-binding EF-hand superfamily protein